MESVYKLKENGLNIYQGHVARKPFIAQICEVVFLQLIRLQLTFVNNSPVLSIFKILVIALQQRAMYSESPEQTLKKESIHRNLSRHHVGGLKQLV